MSEAVERGFGIGDSLRQRHGSRFPVVNRHSEDAETSQTLTSHEPLTPNHDDERPSLRFPSTP